MRRTTSRTTTLIGTFLVVAWLVLAQPVAAQAAGWSTWHDLGPSRAGASGMAAASWGPGRIDLFTISNHEVWTRHYASKAWSGWGSLGSPVDDPVQVTATSTGSFEVAVFALGGSGRTWLKTWTGSRWSNWKSLGGSLTGPISATSWAEGRIDLFGFDGDRAYHRSMDGFVWSPSWESLGALPAPSAVAAVSRQRDSLDVYVPTRAGDVYHLSWNGNGSGKWSPWVPEFRLPEPVSGYPKVPFAATSWANDRVDLLAADSTGFVQRKSWQSSTWGQWKYEPRRPPRSTFADSSHDLTATSWSAGRLDVMIHATDKHDYIATYK